MQPAYILLIVFVLIGLLLLGLLSRARSNMARVLLFVLALVLVNLGTLAVLLAVFAVSRLEGSTPPGLGEVLAPYWLPILLVFGVDGGLVAANMYAKKRIEDTTDDNLP